MMEKPENFRTWEISDDMYNHSCAPLGSNIAAFTSCDTTAVKSRSNLLPPSVAAMRSCERCGSAHAGKYGSGRFCGAACAKQVGAAKKWAIASDRARNLPAMLPVPLSLAPSIPPRPLAPAPSAVQSNRSDSPTTIISAASAPLSPSTSTVNSGSRCEGCSSTHDGSYGSGRFCSVNCARRTAAGRKWAKQRAERKRASTAPTSSSSPISSPALGKRRRMASVANSYMHLHGNARVHQPQPVHYPRHAAIPQHVLHNMGPGGGVRFAYNPSMGYAVPVVPMQLPMAAYFTYGPPSAPMQYPSPFMPMFTGVMPTPAYSSATSPPSLVSISPSKVEANSNDSPKPLETKDIVMSESLRETEKTVKSKGRVKVSKAKEGQLNKVQLDEGASSLISQEGQRNGNDAIEKKLRTNSSNSFEKNQSEMSREKDSAVVEALLCLRSA